MWVPGRPCSASPCQIWSILGAGIGTAQKSFSHAKIEKYVESIQGKISNPCKDVSKLLLISYTVIKQIKFELKSVTQLSLVCVTDFTIEKLPPNSNFLHVTTH